VEGSIQYHLRFFAVEHYHDAIGAWLNVAVVSSASGHASPWNTLWGLLAINRISILSLLADITFDCTSDGKMYLKNVNPLSADQVLWLSGAASIDKYDFQGAKAIIDYSARVTFNTNITYTSNATLGYSNSGFSAGVAIGQNQAPTPGTKQKGGHAEWVCVCKE
jgi:hypothetical protein